MKASFYSDKNQFMIDEKDIKDLKACLLIGTSVALEFEMGNRGGDEHNIEYYQQRQKAYMDLFEKLDTL